MTMFFILVIVDLSCVASLNALIFPFYAPTERCETVVGFFFFCKHVSFMISLKIINSTKVTLISRENRNELFCYVAVSDSTERQN